MEKVKRFLKGNDADPPRQQVQVHPQVGRRRRKSRPRRGEHGWVRENFLENFHMQIFFYIKSDIVSRVPAVHVQEAVAMLIVIIL